MEKYGERKVSKMHRNIFSQIINAYEDAYEEATWEDQTNEAMLMSQLKAMEYQALADEIRSRANRRERYDDDGNIIPEDRGIGGMTFQEKASEERAWMCDKCMSINFGCQTACPECGDRKDEKDETI